MELQLSHPLHPGVVGLLYSSGAHEPSQELQPESSSGSSVASLCWFAEGCGGWVLFSAPHSLFGQPESLPEHEDGWEGNVFFGWVECEILGVFTRVLCFWSFLVLLACFEWVLGNFLRFLSTFCDF